MMSLLRNRVIHSGFFNSLKPLLFFLLDKGQEKLLTSEEALYEHSNKDTFYNQSRYRLKSSEP